MKNEFRIKQKRIQAVLEEHKLDGLLLQQVSSFAWATCGAASYVNLADTQGASQLLVTRNKRFLVTNNIEAPRLIQEEKLAEQGWEIISPHWHDSDQSLARLTRGLTIGSDSPRAGFVDLSSVITRMRAY